MKRGRKKDSSRDEERHSHLVGAIAEKLLELLHLDGAMLFSEIEPNPLGQGQKRIDILALVEEQEGYKIVAIEVKSGDHGVKEAFTQLRTAYSFFVGDWDSWLEKKLGKPQEKEVELVLAIYLTAGAVNLEEMRWTLFPHNLPQHTYLGRYRSVSALAEVDG